MIIRFGWTTPNFDGDWQMMREDIDERKVADWADNHPDSIFFFINISTDI